MPDKDQVCEICGATAAVQLLDRNDGSKHYFCSDHENDFLSPPGTRDPRFVIERFRLPPGNVLSEHLAAIPTSPEHRMFRSEMCEYGMLGGDGACRYYLSILTNSDQFVAWSDEFVNNVKQYVVEMTCPEAAQFCTDLHSIQCLAGFFRVVMERIEGRYEGRNKKQDLAIESLLLHPHWTDEEIAESVPTTVKQLRRFSDYKLLRSVCTRGHARPNDE